VESFDRHDYDLCSVKQAVMYTGDIRAEKAMVYKLSLNAAVRPYLHSRHLLDLESGPKLSNIYLDTALALCNVESLTRVRPCLAFLRGEPNASECRTKLSRGPLL